MGPPRVFQGQTFPGHRPLAAPFGLILRNFPGRALEELPAHGPVTHLGVLGGKVTSADLEALAELTSLTHLDLSGTQVTGVGLKHLAGLKNLTFLRLDSTAVPDHWLKSVGGQENLTTLSLGDTRLPVTDAGLGHLSRLRNLAHPNLGGNPPSPGLTDEGVKELKKSLPDCVIETKR